MTNRELTVPAPVTQPAPWRVPRWLLLPRNLVLVAIAVVGAGLALNWSWLTAIGAAPLILSLAPCAVMCATGYCVMCKSKSKGCDADKSPVALPGTTRD